MRKGIITKDTEKEGVKYAISVEHEGNKIISAVCDLSISDNTEGLPVNKTGIITVSGGIIAVSVPEGQNLTGIYENFENMFKEVKAIASDPTNQKE